MILAKTNSGFEIELDDSLMDNAELVEDLLSMQQLENDPAALFRAVGRVLGTEGKKKLYDHLRTPDGRVPVAALATALDELLNSFAAGKNSSSSPN